jgi:ribulose-phosphate 3-epimerase
MPKLVPSILETTKEGFLNIYRQETKLMGVERIQVDFGDGIFVPNKILDISEIDLLSPAIHWEAHLMVNEPKDFLDYQICGFKTIIVHYEAFKNQKDLLEAVLAIKTMGMDPAVCLKNETPVSVAKDLSQYVNHFQLMGVNPGFQGSPFFENTYERVAELRSLLPNAIIEVDGGINIENLKKISQSGADLLILGSSITKVPNMQEAWEQLGQQLTVNN